MQHHTGNHHLSVRRRAYKKLEPYPHPHLSVRSLDRIMVFISLIGPVAMLPQVYDVFARQSASGLSLTTWSLWTLLAIVWIYYGYVHKEKPILFANIAYFVLQGLVVFGILIYS